MSTSTELRDGIEQVREIVVGAIQRDLERKVARVEAHLTARLGEIQQEARRRTEVIEAHLRKESDALSSRLDPATRICGDRVRLFRVLTNLIDNAIRNSPAGSTVRIVTRQEDGTVRVSVEDEGPGVSPDLLPHLFEKFARGADGGSGTGLGLFFCRITVENWGGGIGYERRDNGGARFWIRLRTMGRSAEDGEAALARR